MRIIKKISPIVFLFSTVAGLNGTLSQTTETFANMCIKNPVLTYAASSIIGGAGAGIAFKLLDTLEQDEEKKTAFTELAEAFGTLVFYLSLVSIVGFGSQNLREAISQETVEIVPFITVPLYVASCFGTFRLLEWKNM